MHFLSKTIYCSIALASVGNALSTSLSGKRTSISQIRNEIEERRSSLIKRDDTDPALLYPEYNFSTPIDHFHNESKYEPHSNGSYPMRYWFDATYYKPGGPVIILQSGESDASGRLPFLQKGLLHDLAAATNGIGVVMEHRYYGTSFPTPDLSTKNLRFLTTEQALADAVYFAQNIAFAGLEQYGDLTSKTTAYLGYGGSYSGAFNAFLRVQYPDVFWGTISSSGVTKAIYDFWEYYEPVAEYAPQDCVAAQKTLTHIVDNILIGKNSTSLTSQLKNAFGLGDVTYDNDFASVLSGGIGNWQSLNWDPAISSPEFYNYCANISDTDIVYPATKNLSSTVTSLITKAGYNASSSLVNQMLNYIGYVNLTSVAPCTASNRTQDMCFSNHNLTYYHQDSLDDSWRSWPYQYCTQWGYLQTGSGVPANELPLISRTLDLEYETLICRDAFGIYNAPDTEAINKYGGYNISYPRLAIVDGEWDPWRPATPHAFGYGAQPRFSTASEPFILIPGAVHHWDENGVFPNQTTSTFPPATVADTQKTEVQFVKEWMEEWALKCLVQGGGCS
ncbi:hypothetical protein LTR56_001396 [Elasticomyces elasticus]|nr:hypothetical protein LTR56_001396 [Elasticomyces elasticus]KAK3668680.1 hypothetical protein LTR22_000567 [Elasticomyces elasticus]KAK4932032.1 hypothetical protein LTR49_001719 [Elasticomyces elasticus]KAK5768436.1 hypothetical protein LTS12_001224 [Elasticomyces elasticus]